MWVKLADFPLDLVGREFKHCWRTQQTLRLMVGEGQEIEDEKEAREEVNSIYSNPILFYDGFFILQINFISVKHRFFFYLSLKVPTSRSRNETGTATIL